MADLGLNPLEARVAQVDLPRSEDYLSADEVAAITPAILRERTLALKPMIAARARDTELARRPLPDVWSALARAGIFYHFVPKRYGGLEFGFEDMVDIMMPVAEACASTGWAATFCVEHNYIFSQFPKEAQDEVYARLPYMIAPGTASPPGKARKAPRGLRVSGHWKWGSGIMNSDWVMAQVIIEDGTPQNGMPDMAFVAFPIEDCTVLDTWQMSGMCGTGSNDFVVDDIFVPEHRVLPSRHFINCDGPGALSQDNIMYRGAMVPFTAVACAIPALGAARAAVDFYADKIKTRLIMGTQTRLMDTQAAQIRLGRADMLARTAELLVRDGCRTMKREVDAGNQHDSVWRRRVRAQISEAVHLCRDAISVAMDGSGASAHALDVPIQRYQRDCNVVVTHALYEPDANHEAQGRALLDLAPAGPMF